MGLPDGSTISAEPRNERKPSRNRLVALTGATGFIGTVSAQGAAEARLSLARACCGAPTTLPEGCAGAVIGDLARPYNMAEALAGVDAVIHTAGLAGTMTGVPEDDYRLFNTEATVGFARRHSAHKIKRFVFLSSIRAQSGPTAEGVLTEDREPQPTDAYGRSKLAAEQGFAHDRPRLGGAQACPRVWTRRRREHGEARSSSPARPTLCRLPGSRASTLCSVSTILWSRRYRARGGRAVAAPAHRRRSQAAHHRRDDCCNAARSRQASRPLLRAAAAAQGHASRRRAGPRVSSRCSARSSPIRRSLRVLNGCRASTPRPDLLRCSAPALHLDAASQRTLTLCMSANADALCTAKPLTQVRACCLTFVAFCCYEVTMADVGVAVRNEALALRTCTLSPRDQNAQSAS